MPKRKEWIECHLERSLQVCQSRLCQKEKSHLSKSPNREVGENQDGRKPQLGERKKGSDREHGEERRDSTVKKGRFQIGEGMQPKRASL